jgi:hypothetical protein
MLQYVLCAFEYVADTSHRRHQRGWRQCSIMTKIYLRINCYSSLDNTMKLEVDCCVFILLWEEMQIWVLFICSVRRKNAITLSCCVIDILSLGCGWNLWDFEVKVGSWVGVYGRWTLMTLYYDTSYHCQYHWKWRLWMASFQHGEFGGWWLRVELHWIVDIQWQCWWCWLQWQHQSSA